MANKDTYDADSISVLEGLEAVRKRPGMYIGSTSTKGLNHLIYEIVDNAVDEHLAGFCSEIHVTLEKDGSATVVDNGRGVPVGMHAKGMSAARLVYTTLHAGGKFDDSAYKTSGGLHGVGSSVVNALSAWMDVEISRDGYVHHDRYERGVPVIELEDGLLPKISKTRKTGTKVSFLPDDTIFEKTKFRGEEIKSRMHETAYLNPNLTIIYEDKRGEETEHIEYHEPDGIIGFIRDLNAKKEVIHEPVYYQGTAEGVEVEVAFQYVNEFHENVLGFCNNIYNAEGGTHLTGFKTTFTTVMNQYARELGILKDKDANFTGADIRNGMTAIVSIKHSDPRFEGQTKTKLDNPDAAKATGKVTGEEVVQTHHGLPHLEQMFQQVGADETGNAGHQPGGGFGTHFFAQLGIGGHIAFLIRGRGCPPGGRENGRTRLRGTDGVLSLYAVPTPLSKDGPPAPAGAFLPHPAGIAFFCSHPVPARRAPLPLFSGKGCWYSP